MTSNLNENSLSEVLEDRVILETNPNKIELSIEKWAIAGLDDRNTETGNDKNNKADNKTKELLLLCEKQLKNSMDGKFTYKVFDLVDGQIPNAAFKLQGQAIQKHLENCSKVVFMCATLSNGVDLLIRKMQINGMAEAMITDSLASAVIEQVCDKAEEIILKNILILISKL